MCLMTEASFERGVAVHGIAMLKAAKPMRLTVEGFPNNDGRLAGKIERYEEQAVEYAYQYDATGHLLSVHRDGVETESYRYNEIGQRIGHLREYSGFYNNTEGTLYYNEAGQLIQAGNTSFEYDERGALSERHDNRGITKYFYGDDTMPDVVVLPSEVEIRYEYDESNPIGPARRFKNGILTAELVWLNPLCLSAYRDHEYLIDYSFAYAANGYLDRVRITPFVPEKTDDTTDEVTILVSQGHGDRWKRLQNFFDQHTMPLELVCGCDQVGTLRTLSTRDSGLVKEILYDSFGLPLYDSFPDLFIPIGFAGGLVDPDTGLVRFGYRDYDSTVGRFTAPDPLGDTGGDHDLYDYCVDDPVNLNDPSGLIPPLLLLGAGMVGAGTLGFGAPYAITKGIDAYRGDNFASSSMHEIAPYAAGAFGAGTLPGLAAFVPGAITAVGNSRYGSIIRNVGEATEGYLNPNWSSGVTVPSGIGAVAAEVKSWFD